MMKVRDYMGTEQTVRCSKCQDKVTITITTFSRTPNNVVVLKGTHDVCGTVCVRLAGKIED